MEFTGNACIRSSAPLEIPSTPQLDADTYCTADTGATSHMTPHKHWLRSYRPLIVPICLAAHQIIYSAGRGLVVFNPRMAGGGRHPVELTKVLHVPKLHSNLLTVLYLTQSCDFNIHINFQTMSFIKNKTILFTAMINDNNSAHLDGQT